MIIRELIARLGFKWDPKPSDQRKYKQFIKGFRDDIVNLDKSLNRTGNMLGRLFTGLAVAGVGRSMITTIDQFQKLNAQLQTLEGEEAAKKQFELLKQFATTAPFQLSNIVKAYATLRGAGLKPTTEEMAILGDMAAGMAADITDVSEAFAKASIGNFELLRDRLKIAVTQANGQVTLAFGDFKKTVKKDSKEVQKALLELGRMKFAGGMERQMKTLGGAFSLLQDNLANFANKVGEAGFAAALARLSKFFQDLASEAGEKGLAKQLGKVLGGAIDGLIEGMKWIKENGPLIRAALTGMIVREAVLFFLRLAAAMMKFNRAAALANLKLLAIVGGLLLLEDIIAFFRGKDSVVGDLTSDLDKGIDTVEGFGARMAQLLINFFDTVSDLIVLITKFFYHLLDIGSETMVVLVNGFEWFINSLSEGIRFIFDTVSREFNQFINEARALIARLPGGKKFLELGAKVVAGGDSLAASAIDLITGGATPTAGEMGAGRGLATATTVNAPITVNPSPGMDEEQLARLTARHVQAQQSDATRRELRSQIRNAREDRRGGVQ